jgi:ABC-type iron transport system FetAB ATPase subunit
MLLVERLEVAALEPVSFALAAGEALAVMGPSGAGKSLLLRALADLDPAAGHVFLEGAERAEMSGPAWRRLVRYVAAEPGWWAETPRQHLAGGKGLERVLDGLGLPAGLLDRPVALASTGERQRLALARAVADQPKVLLLDEPTASLDPAAAAHVEELIRFQLLRGSGVILATHDRAQARRLAGKLLTIDRGRAILTTFGGESPQRTGAVA